MLIVEVCDSSLDYDREIKLPLYAAAGVSETWLLNLVDDWIERSWGPVGGQYQQHEIVRRGATRSPRAMPDLIISSGALLG